MSAEIVSLTDKNRDIVLVTQSCFKAETTNSLRNKLNRGEWDPNPPVVLTPMPPYYNGRYLFHLYNGNHRDSSAREWGAAINGLVAYVIDDIPRSEVPNKNMLLTPDNMLRLGLVNLIGVVYGAEARGKQLEELVSELQELEKMLTHEEMIAYFR